jgi:hypothetical protein
LRHAVKSKIFDNLDTSDSKHPSLTPFMEPQSQKEDILSFFPKKECYNVEVCQSLGEKLKIIIKIKITHQQVIRQLKQ